MPGRHPRPVPRVWLMTDERQDDALWTALGRLPRGAGVIFRHYSLPRDERRALFERVRVVARRRGLLLSLAATPQLAAAWRADGVHGASTRHLLRLMLRSMACHDRRQLVTGRRSGVDLRFVSPLFDTRSHPSARTLGAVRAGLMIAGERHGLIALGGMTAARYRGVARLGFTGWAAIDAWAD